VAAARWVLETCDVRHPYDLHMARVASALGADVVYRTTGAGDGRSWRTDRRALIIVNEIHRGLPRGRWTIAHELAHVLLHHDLDAIARIHGGGEISGKDRALEREADIFAAELLMPEATFASLCTHDRPTVDTLDLLGTLYGTSITATGNRYAKYARAACAMLECKRGRVSKAVRSEAFRGEAVERRALDEDSAAARLLRGEPVSGPERVTTGAWGAEWLDGEMTEHAIMVDPGVVVVWLCHAD
jgi:Zn-dependent peptidase ImmA (M78 family)